MTCCICGRTTAKPSPVILMEGTQAPCCSRCLGYVHAGELDGAETLDGGRAWSLSAWEINKH